ncbi:MAG: glycosyltransferase, partial [Candidatus Omnitrophota bacterium]
LLDCGVKEEKLKPFMHWVDVNVYKPAPRNHKGVNVLFVGRPIPIKGKYIVEEVERKLFYLKGLTFRYIENCPHKDLIQHYQWADILVVPSQYSEGFPRVVFEGAACGCMVIASNKGALSELVDNFGVTNLWDWGQGIAMFYSQPKTVKAYQRKSRLYATKFFTPKNAETILNEY